MAGSNGEQVRSKDNKLVAHGLTTANDYDKFDLYLHSEGKSKTSCFTDLDSSAFFSLLGLA